MVLLRGTMVVSGLFDGDTGKGGVVIKSESTDMLCR